MSLEVNEFTIMSSSFRAQPVRGFAPEAGGPTGDMCRDTARVRTRLKATIESPQPGPTAAASTYTEIRR